MSGVSGIGERLRAAMVLRGMTIRALAHRLDVDQKLVERWRRDANQPRLETAIALADALEVSLDYLAGRTDDPEIRRGPIAGGAPRISREELAGLGEAVDRALGRAPAAGPRRDRRQGQSPGAAGPPAS